MINNFLDEDTSRWFLLDNNDDSKGGICLRDLSIKEPIKKETDILWCGIYFRIIKLEKIYLENELMQCNEYDILQLLSNIHFSRFIANCLDKFATNIINGNY